MQEKRMARLHYTDIHVKINVCIHVYIHMCIRAHTHMCIYKTHTEICVILIFYELALLKTPGRKLRPRPVCFRAAGVMPKRPHFQVIPHYHVSHYSYCC